MRIIHSDLPLPNKFLTPYLCRDRRPNFNHPNKTWAILRKLGHQSSAVNSSGRALIQQKLDI